MTGSDWRQRVTSDPAVHHGEPCIRGTRVSVSAIVGSLADMNKEELLAQFPQLTSEDIQAALYFAAEAAHSSMVA